VVSNKKAELNHILDQFNIQVFVLKSLNVIHCCIIWLRTLCKICDVYQVLCLCFRLIIQCQFWTKTPAEISCMHQIQERNIRSTINFILTNYGHHLPKTNHPPPMTTQNHHLLTTIIYSPPSPSHHQHPPITSYCHQYPWNWFFSILTVLPKSHPTGTDEQWLSYHSRTSENNVKYIGEKERGTAVWTVNRTMHTMLHMIKQRGVFFTTLTLF
jgi:hypothetical protein